MVQKTVHIQSYRVKVGRNRAGNRIVFLFSFCWCTIGKVNVRNPSLSHSFLNGKVQHGLFLSVVNTCYAAVVTLALVGFQLLNHLAGQVLHSHLGIVLEELLTLHHNLADALTVYLYVSLIIHLCSRQFLHQFL